MSEYDIQTRLFGKEDIDFDTEGTGAQTQYTDLDGETHPVTKLNASHIPITHSARIATEGATNVDDAVKELSKEIRDLAGQNGIGQSSDRTIVLAEQDSRQSQINEPFRNLGGHTLTFKFLEEGEVQVALAPLEFQGFYNGVLVIDLNGCDIHDNGTFSPEGVLRIKNCHCHVRIIGDGRSSAGYGKIIFTDNHYGIAVIESPSCSVEHMAFESSSTADDFALYTESGNAFFTSCTFTGCGRALIKSIYRDYVDAHLVDVQAHSALFAAKAALNHTHAESHISGLEDDLSNKAPLNHSHSLDDITNFSSGSLNSAHWADSAGNAVYSGPFAILPDEENEGKYKINGGIVYAGGSSYNVAEVDNMEIDSDYVYLVMSSGGGSVTSSYTSSPTGYGNPDVLIAKIGGVHAPNVEQFQYGNITCVPWGASQKTYIDFTSGVTISAGNASGARIGYTTGETVSSGATVYTKVGSGLGGVLMGEIEAPYNSAAWESSGQTGTGWAEVFYTFVGSSNVRSMTLLRPKCQVIRNTYEQYVSGGSSTTYTEYENIYHPLNAYVYIPIEAETKFFIDVFEQGQGMGSNTLKFYPRVPLNS